MSFIEVCALLHQHQRQRVTIGEEEYLVATVGDYSTVYYLLREVLEDAFAELNPSSQALLDAAKAIQQKVPEDKYFTRKDLCKEVGWEKTKVFRAVEPLEIAGYLNIKMVGNAYTYRVAFEDEIKNLVDLVLTPETLYDKVLANKESIDPRYGESYLKT